MVFLLGALCYTICTMKAPPQALPGPGEESSWHLRKPPFQGLERRLHGVPVRCSVLYNMHHEGSSSGPGRACMGIPGPGEEPSWHLPFHGIYGSLLSRAWRGGFIVFLFGTLCYTICTGEEPSWLLFFCERYV